jgi:hypothetical protein
MTSNIVTELKSVEGHDYDANDVILAKNAADALNTHYPGHLWMVHVNSEQGILVIKNNAVSSMWGYILHINKIDPDMKRVMRAGGELLERGWMKRGAWNGQFATEVEGIPEKYQSG